MCTFLILSFIIAGLCGSAGGKTLMETWGYDPLERLEIHEGLHSLRLAYQEEGPG